MSINLEANRTWRKDGIVSVDGTPYAFVQGMTITLDANIFARDFTGAGESVFTQNGDVIGSFSFALKNTVDVYNTGTSTITDSDTLLSTWLLKIADINPPVITFIQTYFARKASSDKRVRITFTGRIMTPQLSQLVDVAVDDAVIDGEITSLTPIVRDT